MAGESHRLPVETPVLERPGERQEAAVADHEVARERDDLARPQRAADKRAGQHADALIADAVVVEVQVREPSQRPASLGRDERADACHIRKVNPPRSQRRGREGGGTMVLLWAIRLPPSSPSFEIRLSQKRSSFRLHLRAARRS